MKLNNELLLSGYKHEVIWETLARVKCLKTSNENVLVSLLMGTWNLMNIFQKNARKQEENFMHLEKYVNF